MTSQHQPPPGLSFDDYLEALRQVDRTAREGSRPRRGLWRRGPSIPPDPEHADQLDLPTAERIAATLTEQQRRSPGRAGWPKTRLVAEAAGVQAWKARRLLARFDYMTAYVNAYRDELLRLGPWGRVKVLSGFSRLKPEVRLPKHRFRRKR